VEQEGEGPTRPFYFANILRDERLPDLYQISADMAKHRANCPPGVLRLLKCKSFKNLRIEIQRPEYSVLFSNIRDLFCGFCSFVSKKISIVPSKSEKFVFTK
jgi:hypothetical protein